MTSIVSRSTIFGLVGLRVHHLASSARHQVQIYAWHLRHLLPKDVTTRSGAR